MKIGELNVTKYGQVVTITRFYGTCGVEIPANNVQVSLGTLPEGWRPASNVYAPLKVDGGGDVTDQFLIALSTGSVVIQNGSSTVFPATKHISVNMTFIATK